jgi:MraZ protein
MSLRGSYSARIDDRNRVKVPAEFRRVMESTWGNQVFVTSQTGRDVLVYPLPVWQEFEARLMKLPLIQPARMRIQKVVNFYGQTQSIDGQGRVLLHAPLLQRAGIRDEVMVLGYGNHLLLQDAESIRADVEQFDERDLETLSDLWSKE